MTGWLALALAIGVAAVHASSGNATTAAPPLESIMSCDFDYTCDLTLDGKISVVGARAIQVRGLAGPWFDHTTGKKEGELGFINGNARAKSTKYVQGPGPVCASVFYYLDCPGYTLQLLWNDGQRRMGVAQADTHESYWRSLQSTIYTSTSRSYQMEITAAVDAMMTSSSKCAIAIDDFNVTKGDCSTRKDVPGGYLPVRLTGGATNEEGHVEVMWNGTWGTICGHFGWSEAVTVCRQLGFSGGRSQYLSMPSPPSTQPLLDGIRCPEFGASHLAACHHKGWGELSCDPTYTARVRCNDEEISQLSSRLRLRSAANIGQSTSGAQSVGGLVMLNHRGKWSGICADTYWNSGKGARAVCSMLGFHGLWQWGSQPGGTDSHDLHYSVRMTSCPVGATDIFDCNMDFTENRCDFYGYVTCTVRKELVPYNCDYMSRRPCDLHNATDDDADWTPTGLAPRQYSNFKQAAWGYPEGRATLITKTFDAGPLTSYMCLRYQYYVSSQDAGPLRVYVQSPGDLRPTLIRWTDSLGGMREGQVFQAEVDVPRSKFMVLFEAGLSTTYRGYLELLGYSVTESLCGGTDMVTTTTPHPGGTGRVLINCTFEEPCSELQDVTQGTDFTFTRLNTRTPSSNTGPETGHNGGYYVYVEASSPRYPGHRARMRSVDFFQGVSFGRCLRFWYHMNGELGMGTLNVYWGDKLIDTKKGHKGKEWLMETVEIPREAGRLTFEGVRGSDYRSDLAIDDISLVEGPCDGAMATTTTTAAPNPCFSSPCYNNGSCRPLTEGGYYCSCPYRFMGWRCETKCPPGTDMEVFCFLNPCDPRGASCPGYPNATCRANYCGGCNAEWYYREMRVNCNRACSSSPCMNNGRCEPEGSNLYRCMCPAGYTGSRCEREVYGLIDPNCDMTAAVSVSTNCQVEAQGSTMMAGNTSIEGVVIRACDNVRERFGSWDQCLTRRMPSSCPNYLRLQREAIQIQLRFCQQLPSCPNLMENVKTFVNCTIQSSMAMSNTTHPVTDPCQIGIRMYNNMRTCYRSRPDVCPALLRLAEENMELFTRICYPDSSPCRSGPCLNGGVCIQRGKESFSCDCPRGYNGTRCESENGSCRSSPCLNGATCVDVPSGYECRCIAGYDGNRCETKTERPFDPSCSLETVNRVTAECTRTCVPSPDTAASHTYSSLAQVYRSNCQAAKIWIPRFNDCMVRRMPPECSSFLRGSLESVNIYLRLCKEIFLCQDPERALQTMVRCSQGSQNGFGADVSFTSHNICYEGLKTYEDVRLCYKKQTEVCPALTRQLEASTELLQKLCFPDNSVCSGRLVDVAFIIDRSGSITKEGWQELLQSLANLVNIMDIGLDKVRLSLVAYSTSPQIVASLEECRSSKEATTKILCGLGWPDGNTNTADALSAVQFDVFDASRSGRRGDRPDVPDVAVLFTDGHSNFNHLLTKTRATNLKNAGIKILVVGMANADQDEVKAISSTGIFNDTYWMHRELSLPRGMLPHIARKICSYGIGTSGPCFSAPCRHGATCVPRDETSSESSSETSSGFYCRCPTGYTGELCQNPPRDPCASYPCRNGGSCYKDGESFVCRCQVGYIGNQCQTSSRNPCASYPCFNGGTCVRDGESFVCRCQSGYWGDFCQTSSRDPCASYPCKNGGTCFRDGESFGCRCQFGYTGYLCQNSTRDPCASYPCINGGTCVRDGESFFCRCQAGYWGTFCQTSSRDPCASYPCRNGGTCFRDGESFVCRCLVGYTGVVCQNSTQDPCISYPCRNGGTCFRDGESFACRCLAGYTGERCQNARPDPCSSYPCMNGGSCIKDGESFACRCLAGYTGSLCQTSTGDPCASLPCRNGGTCYRDDITDGFYCLCPMPFTGQNCEKGGVTTQRPTSRSSTTPSRPPTTIPTTTRYPCRAIPTCINSCPLGRVNDVNGCPTCDCYRPCKEKRCEQGETCKTEQICNNDGRCEYTSRCIRGEDVCFDQPPTAGQQTCNRVSPRLRYFYNMESQSCQLVEWDGCGESKNNFVFQQDCQEVCAGIVSPCTSSPCQNGGSCERREERFICRCQPGFMGDFCQNRDQPDACDSDPCLNGGRCFVDSQTGGARCVCAGGFTGVFCETPPDETDCEFKDSDDCKFKNVRMADSGPVEWTWRNIATPSGSTGPLADHTTGRSGEGGYMYVESSGQERVGKHARMESQVLNGNRFCLRFFYHMWGADMGRLEVNVMRVAEEAGSALRSAVHDAQKTRIPDQDMGYAKNYGSPEHNRWMEKKVSIFEDGATRIKICFDAYVGRGWRSDIAVDDISIKPGDCDGAP